MAAKRSKIQVQPEHEKIPVGPVNPLVMSGLREDNPRDFLAALGVLRFVDMLWPDQLPTLGWNADGHPVLRVATFLPPNWSQLMWAELQRLNESAHSPFRHGKIEMFEEGTFRKLLLSPEEMGGFCSQFYPALCAQLEYVKSGKRSQLIIESASRSVLNGVKSLLGDLRFHPDLCGDLRGTTPLDEVSNTPRWNPEEAQSAAYCAADPQTIKLMDRRSLNVIGLIGLTFYPVVDGTRQRETLGTSKRPRQDRVFTWPIHDCPLGCDPLSSLLHDPVLHVEQPDPTTLAPKGIRAAWRSRRFTLNQNDYFSPASALI